MIQTPTKPAPPRTKAMPFSKDDPKRQQKLLIGGIGAAALIVAVAVAVIFRPWRTPVPRLNDEPYKLAQLVAGPEFQKLPFDQREIYMKMIDHKKDVISQAYNSGKITDTEYRKALEAAHLGKQLDIMKKYFERAPGHDREAYLDKVLDKKDKKQTTRKHSTDAKKEKKEQDVLRDDSEETVEISNWPSDVQAKWNVYRAALAERKKSHKETRQSQHSGGHKASTKPAKQ